MLMTGQSRYSVLLLVASLAYSTDSLANILSANYDDYQAIFDMVVLAPAVIAELSMCLWLLLKGVKVQKQDNSISLNTTQSEGMAT